MWPAPFVGEPRSFMAYKCAMSLRNCRCRKEMRNAGRMLKNAAAAGSLNAEAYDCGYVEADRRLRTQPTALFSILLEIGVFRDCQRKVLAAFFVEHPPGRQIAQYGTQYIFA